MKKEARGTFDHRYDCKDGILIARWNDKSVVTVASNCCGIQPIAQASRWSTAEGRRVMINQPDLIQKYNKSMGGVDRLDQNVATYRINIRTKKWPLWGDKVSMLTHIYPHKPWRNIEVTICKITRLTAHFMCGLMSDLLICTCL